MSKKNKNKISAFKIFSILLSYPEAHWIDEVSELVTYLKEENRCTEKMIAQIESIALKFQTKDLLTLQSEYVLLFDQNRILSLHLFEHIHGESRDRGQAMVDLMNVYEKNGFVIDAKELPDYLPLFLEFLSVIPADEALALLNECIHIVEKIAQQLAERGSDYTAIFNGILTLAKKPLFTWKSRVQPHLDLAMAEKLDAEWAEEEIKFLGNNTAANNQSECNGKVYGVDVASIMKRTKQPLSGEKQ